MPESQRRKRKVLLIGWDGADWEHINPMLEEGLMPTLEKFINGGVMGNLATLQPVLSPMLWNSVATGKYADKHGIHGFIEPDPVNGGARPYTSTSRKCKALWNIFTQSGMRSNVVGWWASHPAEPINGTVVTNSFNGIKFDPETGWHVPGGTIHPPGRAAALGRMRVLPHELTHEHVFPFIPNAGRIDQENDLRLQTFAKLLTDTASIHAVATAIMELEPWDFMGVYYDSIDHFCHAFMQYHPPRMPMIPEEDFEIYKDVVRGAYRFHDMMLERLLHLSGPDTTVILCSDHGFESGSQRPFGVSREPAGPADWHRQYGILVINGPGIRKDDRIYGASLIDIAPTILTMFDLPIGEDMDGRPLIEAFEQAPEVKTIPTWEDVPGVCGMHPPGATLDADQSQELMQQFAALGYIENTGDDKLAASESADIEAKYNLARLYMWTNRPDLARPLFEDILRRRPWEDRFIGQLASCYHLAGYLTQAERLLRTSFDLDGKERSAPLLLLFGNIQIALGRLDEGLKYLLEAEQLDSRNPGVFVQIGDVHARMRRWDDAERAYKRAIAIDEDSARAYQGLSSVYRRKGMNQATVDAALNAVSLLHRLPIAHFNLGVALARSKDVERAKLAFETALRFNPNLIAAHRWLAAIYRSKLDDSVKADHHQQQIEAITAKTQLTTQWLSHRNEESWELPAIPPLNERTRILLKERPDKEDPRKKSGKTFVIVSGLPRSGTSLMMQMLDAGGLHAMTDNERAADVNNPKGYFEWEAIKQIAKKPELLDDPAIEGKVIKAVSMLLTKMPVKHQYKVVFMTRPIEEVVASQTSMVKNLGTDGAKLDRDQLERGLYAHRVETISWMKTSSHVEFIEVDYPTLVQRPDEVLPKIVEFLGQERLPTAERMRSVIDKSLHRNKAADPIA